MLTPAPAPAPHRALARSLRPSHLSGHFACIDCPRAWHTPPFLPFWMPHNMRYHLGQNPLHRIRFWCLTCNRFSNCAEVPGLTFKGTRGGQRPGAGAPKGNLNRLRHGRYSANPHLKAILARIPTDIRDQIVPYLTDGSIKHRLSRIVTAPSLPDNVLPFPSATTTTPSVQSNPHLQELAYRMTTLGYYGAALFVNQHQPAYGIIEEAVTHVEQMDDARNPAALIRYLVHQELAEAHGALVRCPYCRWTDTRREEQTS